MKSKIFPFLALVLLLITLIVSCKKGVERIIIDTELFLAVGESATLTPTFVPANAHNKEVKWESGDSKVATVDNGTVTGIAVGKTAITVTSLDNYKRFAQCVVTVMQSGKDEFEMVWVEGGTFTMGCTDGDCQISAWGNDVPAHQVTLSSFLIGKYEVTQKQWKDIMGNNPCYYKGDSLPVYHITWDEIQVFIRKLNLLTGRKYRLPTEAEWEYAARGGKQSKGYKYSGSNNLDEVSWYFGNLDGRPQPVGRKKPNELGIYDMSGNVCEYCKDSQRFYTDKPQTNPEGALNEGRAVRGGDVDHGIWAEGLWLHRVSSRWGRNHAVADDAPFSFFGFRLAAD